MIGRARITSSEWRRDEGVSTISPTQSPRCVVFYSNPSAKTRSNTALTSQSAVTASVVNVVPFSVPPQVPSTLA